MKFKFNSKYNTISGYVLMTFALCLLILVILFKFSMIQVYIGKLVKITAPIIWGFVIAYLLNPLLKFFEKYIAKLVNKKKEHKKITRSLALLVTMTVFFAGIIAIIASIVPEIIASLENILGNIQSYFDNIQSFIEKKYAKINNANPELKAFVYDQMDNIESLALSMANSLKPQLENLFSKDGMLASLTGSAWSLILGIKDFLIGSIVAIYILFSKETFLAKTKKTICALFNRRHSASILKVAGDANDKFISFLSGKALDSFIIGILCFIAMSIMGLPYTVLISVIVGITNMIPFFGPFIGAIPSGVLILLSNPKQTIAFVIMIFILQQFDGNILGPKILGNQLGVNAFWILFSIVIGGGFFGFIGMILAVPFFAVVYPMFCDSMRTRLKKKNLPVDTEFYKNGRNALPANVSAAGVNSDKSEEKPKE